MRITVMGKGGSGKTTISAALVRQLADAECPVLAIDADVNTHLSGALGMASQPLERTMDEVNSWLEPEVAKELPVLGTTPPGRTSRFVHVNKDDPFLQRFATWNRDRSVALLTVGSYEPEHAGTECYHGMLQAAELPLHRTLDGESNWVIVDSTAGIDTLGTSMYFASDLNVFVVEPTKKSLEVFADFQRVSAGFGLETFAVANKVQDDQDRAFVENNIEPGRLLGLVGHSPAIRRMEQGDASAMDDFVADNEVILKAITGACPTSRDWEAYLARIRAAYRDNCSSWYNDFYGKELDEYVDAEFRFSDVVIP